MSKIQITLDEYYFFEGDLVVVFMLEDKKYREDSFCEDLFEEYVRKSGKLESFEDRWDYYKEIHYTYDYEVDFSDWLEDYCEKGDITDFLYYYYKTNKIPEEVEE
jgi:hypothetical protein